MICYFCRCELPGDRTVDVCDECAQALAESDGNPGDFEKEEGE